MKIIGVYQIQQSSTGRRYIGQSTNIEKRWKVHQSALRMGKHHSQKLQRAWDKYGAEAFVFKVLETCPEPMLVEREQHWLDSIAPYFNIRMDATPGWSGMRHTPESRASISKNRKGKQIPPEALEAMRRSLTGRKLSDQHRKNIAAAQRGIPRTPETIARIQSAKKKAFEQRRAAGLPAFNRSCVRRKDAALTVEDVLAIKREYVPGGLTGRKGEAVGGRRKTGGPTIRQIADRYGVSYATVWKAINNEKVA